MRYVSAVVALALSAMLVMVLATSVNAEMAAAGGAISGKVVDATGAAVEGAKVVVMPAPVKKNLVAEGGDAPVKPEKPKAAGEATTDAQGKFKVEGLPAGDYIVSASNKEKGFGRAKATVADGQTAEVSIELKPRQAKPKAE